MGHAAVAPRCVRLTEELKEAKIGLRRAEADRERLTEQLEPATTPSASGPSTTWPGSRSS
jgi:hypothetical protein